MRKVILGCAMSLDGYIARPDGSVDFLVMPQDASQALADFFAKLDTILIGRKTWSATKSMGEGPKGPWTSYVFSRSLPPGERDGVIFVNQSPAEFIGELRKRLGKHIFHMGGGELARSFLEADLVDELSLGIVPVLLGEGIPMFPSGFPQRDFKLVECKNHAQGLVALTYQRVRAKPKQNS
jgi:dihydrofolate reductase